MMAARWALASLAVVAPGAVAVAGAVTVGDVTVTTDAGFGAEGRTHGYVEQTFHLTNASPEHSRTVEIRIPAESQMYMSGTVTRTVEVAPGASVSVPLYRSTIAGWGDNASITVDGRSKEVSTPGAGNPFWWGGGSTSRLVLLSPATGSSFPTESTTAPHGATSMDGIRAGAPFTSTSWLAYSAFDGMVMTRSELEDLAPDAGDAIRAWVRAGGVLLVLDVAGELGASWRGRATRRYLGLTVSDLGLGRIYTSAVASGNGLESTELSEVRSDWSAGAKGWGPMGRSDPNLTFPIVDRLDIPVLALLGMMAGYAALIGPINVLVLSRLGRRTWLLATIPALSLATAGLLLAVAFGTEGITPHLRADTLTVLDQGSGRATTLGRLAYYAPITPGHGLALPRDAEITSNAQYPWTASGARIDWGSSQRVTGLLTSRVPAHFEVRRDAERRERLEVQSAGDGVEVVNGLGVDVEELVLCAIDGAVYETRALVAGERRRLAPQQGREPAAPHHDALRSIYGAHDGIVSYPGRVRQELPGLLVPGSYVAYVARDPFVDAGLEKVREVKCAGVVVGFLPREDSRAH